MVDGNHGVHGDDYNHCFDSDVDHSDDDNHGVDGGGDGDGDGHDGEGSVSVCVAAIDCNAAQPSSPTSLSSSSCHHHKRGQDDDNPHHDPCACQLTRTFCDVRKCPVLMVATLHLGYANTGMSYGNMNLCCIMLCVLPC